MLHRIVCPQCHAAVVKIIGRKPGLALWVLVLGLWAMIAWLALDPSLALPAVLADYNKFVVLGAVGLLGLAVLFFGGDPVYECRACLCIWEESARQTWERKHGWR